MQRLLIARQGTGDAQEDSGSEQRGRASKGFPSRRLGNSNQVLAGWVSTINETLILSCPPSPPALPSPPPTSQTREITDQYYYSY